MIFTVREIAGEAYNHPKIMELLSLPFNQYRGYKLRAVEGSSQVAVLELTTVRCVSVEEMRGKLGLTTFQSQLGDRMRALLTVWPECAFLSDHTFYSRDIANARESVTFSVPRPRWDENDTRAIVYANQGWRDADVLAFRMTADGLERLVEYVMPKGTTALRIEGRKQDHNVSYKACPKAFLQYMRNQGIEWECNPQQGGKVKV